MLLDEYTKPLFGEWTHRRSSYARSSGYPRTALGNQARQCLMNVFLRENMKDMALSMEYTPECVFLN